MLNIGSQLQREADLKKVGHSFEFGYQLHRGFHVRDVERDDQAVFGVNGWLWHNSRMV